MAAALMTSWTCDGPLRNNQPIEGKMAKWQNVLTTNYKVLQNAIVLKYLITK